MGALVLKFSVSTAKKPRPIFVFRKDKAMSPEDIKNVLLEIIGDIDEEADLEALDADKPLRDQLDLDSMDFLDIVMELRKRYKLQIPEDEYPELISLNSCVKYLEPKLRDL